MAEENTNIPAADMTFLVSCLKNANGGNISIDYKAVAEELNYGNVGSVRNRASKLGQKYGLPFGGNSGRATGSEGSSPNKVVKKKATPRAKKTAVKVEKEEPTENEPEENGEVEDAEDA